MKWKKIINNKESIPSVLNPQIGMKFKLNRNSNKSGWGFNPEEDNTYDRIFTITKNDNSHRSLYLKDDNGNGWEMEIDFLEEHFEVV